MLMLYVTLSTFYFIYVFDCLFTCLSIYFEGQQVFTRRHLPGSCIATFLASLGYSWWFFWRFVERFSYRYEQPAPCKYLGKEAFFVFLRLQKSWQKETSISYTRHVRTDAIKICNDVWQPNVKETSRRLQLVNSLGLDSN